MKVFFLNYQEEEERPRPDFAAKAPYLEKNPITGVREPSFPQSKRYKRIAAGTALILLMVRTLFNFFENSKRANHETGRVLHFR